MDAVHIPLSRGLFALVDPADVDLVSRFKWYASIPRHGSHYALTHLPGSNATIRMHKLLLPDASMIDHRNGNTLDNRRDNLRPCNAMQNSRNAKKPSTGLTSRFKGVHRCHVHSKPFRATIRLDGKNRHIGLFASEEDAARAYDEAARQHYGEFARLNFHTEVPA